MKERLKLGTALVVGGTMLLAMGVAVAQQSAGKTNPKSASVVTAGKAETVPAAASSSPEYRIGADDLLNVSVWKEPDVSRTLPVRTDGRISLPLIGEVQASGRTTKELETEIRSRLKTYLSDPEVTVVVQEARSQTFNVLGEVFKPGSYRITRPTTVLDAIALAGGFRDFAKRKSLYVLRTKSDGSQTRIPVNYNDVIRGRTPQQNVLLEANDVLVVP